MLAESNRVAIVPIVPNRGVITDRNGVVLAQSYSAYTLELTPAKIRNLEATIDELVDDRRHPAARPQALQEAPRRIQELREHAAAHALDRRGSRALRRQPLSLSRRRHQGAAVPPVPVRRSRLARHRLHRPRHRQGPRAHRVVGRDRELQGLRLHRQGGRRAVLRARAARHDGRGGSRGRRRRARGAHAVAHAARARATTCACRSTSSCRKRRSRPSATAAARWSRSSPSTGDILAFVSQAGLRPQPVRRGHRSRELGAAQRLARQAAAQSSAARRVSAGLDDQAVPALGALTSGKRTPQYSVNDPGFFQLPGSSYRFRDDKPGGHGSVDMYKSIVVSCDTYYYVLASETDIDDTARFLTSSASGTRRAWTSRASCPASCRRANGSARASRARNTARSTASGISATPSRPASGRATTRSRRCSSPTPSRSSPTTASRSSRTS